MQAQQAVHSESVEVAPWVKAAAQDAESRPSELFSRDPVWTRGRGFVYSFMGVPSYGRLGLRGDEPLQGRPRERPKQTKDSKREPAAHSLELQNKLLTGLDATI